MDMRFFVVSPGLRLFPAVLQEQVIRKFLPFELIPYSWSCQERDLLENLTSLYEPSNIRINIYGAPENLRNYLWNFMSFSQNQEFFNIDDTVFYKVIMQSFQSLGGNTYFYRMDLYELLYKYIPEFYTLSSIKTLAKNLMCYYFRTLKNKLTTSHEMVLIDKEFERSLSDMKPLIEKKMKTGEWKKQKAFDPKNNDELLNYLNELFMNTEVKAGMGAGMCKTVTTVTEGTPVNENIFEYKEMLTWLHLTMTSFEDFISKNKNRMFSRSETVDSFPVSKIPVRLFESDQEKVVMPHELLHAIKLEKLDVSGFEDKILAMPKLSAMGFREVFEMVPRDVVKMLEFIRVPLSDIPKELPIYATIEGSYCISAYQFLLMILCDAIIVKKVFQGMKKDQSSHIMSEFYAMLEDSLCQGNYFVSYDKYKETKLFLRTWFKKHFPSPNQKEISIANENGFTCKDVRNQLKRLELSEIFPDIEKYACKKTACRPTFGCPHGLTKQLLQRIQDAQFSYVFENFPNKLTTIFHERKWCVKLRLDNCLLCSEKENNEPSEETAKGSNVSVERKAVKEEDSLNENVVVSLDSSSSDKALETSFTKNPDDSNAESLSSSLCSGKQSNKPSVNTENGSNVSVERKTVEEREESPNKFVIFSYDFLNSDEDLETSFQKDSKPESLSSSTNVSKVVVEKQKSVRKPEKPRNKMEKPAVKPEIKESQICPESIQTSELTKTRNEKLRLSEMENVKLKKELSEVVLELDEKNERIRFLEEKLRENETQTNFMNSQLVSMNIVEKQQVENEDEQTETLIATLNGDIPKRNLTTKFRDFLLSKLLEAKKILSEEDPLRKSRDVCDALIANTNSEVAQEFVKCESASFQLLVSLYIRDVKNNIRLLQENKEVQFDQVFESLHFPQFSNQFKKLYKTIMKEKAPVLCRQLLNLTDEIPDAKCLTPEDRE